MSIGENIKRLRTEYGMSQSEFGAIVSVTDKAVSTWELGIKIPRIKTIQKIADYFDMSLSEIVEDLPSCVDTSAQLSNIVKEYRAEHGLSQRQFAMTCGLSNGYISMLENGVNPKTGLPLSPSVVALKKIATGMGIALNELLSRVDDMPVDLSLPGDFTASDATNVPSELTEFLTLFRKLTPEEKKMLIAQMRGLTTGR